MRRFDLIQTGAVMGLGAIGLMTLSATATVAAPLGKYTFENSAVAFITSSETTATGINLSAFSHSDGVTLSSNAGSGNPGLAYQSNGWTRKNEPAGTDFVSFTVSPMANMQLCLIPSVVPDWETQGQSYGRCALVLTGLPGRWIQAVWETLIAGVRLR
jgi:hypothetical protein